MVGRNGEPDVEDLLRSAAGALSRFRRRIPDAVIEELCQEAAARTLRTPDVRDSRPFVYQIARNLALDWLRRKREVGLDPRTDGPGDATWQHQIERQLDLRAVLAVLEAAPLPYRELLQALFFRQLDLEDLVDEEVERRGDDPADTEAHQRARDALYKRRARAIAWIRHRLVSNQVP